MSLSVTYHNLAQAEINEAKAYYAHVSPRLASAFLDEIERAVRLITEFPHSNPIIRAKVRRKLVRKFPYAIIYSIRQEEIRILAIANTKRRPFYWRGRG